MVDVDERLTVLSSKRSTHHAFLEGLLRGKRYRYDNNAVVDKTGALKVKRTTSSDEPEDAPYYYVASFERAYALPDLYATRAFQELEEQHTSPGPVRRVIFLRDPLNTLASTYRVHLESPRFSDFKYVRANVRQWAGVARYLLDGQGEEIFVYANHFWADEDYRNARLAELNASSYRHSSKLSRFGGGGNTWFEKGQAVTPGSLAARYLTYADDERFVALVREHADLFEAFSEYVGDREIGSALRAF